MFLVANQTIVVDDIRMILDFLFYDVPEAASFQIQAATAGSLQPEAAGSSACRDGFATYVVLVFSNKIIK
jgi:hypothetical protein